VYPLLKATTIEVFLRFRDFTGKYPMHCHNLVHEDHAMMVRWDIKP
jgi:FtsP/CotA-like multicopper oxidase with cupredoxin domain